MDNVIQGLAVVALLPSTGQTHPNDVSYQPTAMTNTFGSKSAVVEKEDNYNATIAEYVISEYVIYFPGSMAFLRCQPGLVLYGHLFRIVKLETFDSYIGLPITRTEHYHPIVVGSYP